MQMDNGKPCPGAEGSDHRGLCGRPRFVSQMTEMIAPCQGLRASILSQKPVLPDPINGLWARQRVHRKGFRSFTAP